MDGSHGIGAADDAAKLRELPLAGGVGGAGGVRPGELGRPRVELKPESRRETGGSQKAERVFLEGGLGRRTEDAGLGVGDAAGGVDRVPTGQRDGDRIDGEVAGAQVVLDRIRAQRGHVHVPPIGRRDGPPGGELLREDECRPPGDARDRPGGLLLGPALHGQIGVGDLPVEQGVADRAAHDPHLAGALLERGPGGRDRGRSGESLLERGAHSSTSRGTRCEIPQVTS